MGSPEISILMSIKDQGKYLKKCIESILSQDFENFEYEKEFKNFTMIENGKQFYPDEEVWISVLKPHSLNKQNVIYGGFLTSHFAFGVQRMMLESTENNICLRLYEELAGIK